MQDFVYALTFVSSAAEKPVTLGVATDLVRGDIFFWGSLMAGALIVSAAGRDPLQLLPRPLRRRDHRGRRK